jgi:Flp pilus assembly protein TadG
MKRLTRLRRDESGMTYVFVGLGLMALLSASMLAIDVGMLMTARSQAQNAADAGALAGATAFVYDSYTDRTATGPAKTSAVNAALENQVIGRTVSVTPDDVEFPVAPSGQSDRVRVTVYRRAQRGNAVSTLIARYFGTQTVDIGAVATAEAAPANAMSCVKPFTVPDKWIERQTPPWDPSDTYDAFDQKGHALANPDVYIPTGSGYTGYDAVRDRGTLLTIRAGTGNNITPSFYFSIALGGVSGGSEYRWNIANCNTTLYHPGDLLLQEPGNMVGPTTQGAQDLIDRDPSAYWDTSTNTVKGSQFGLHSPRVFPLPIYDPVYYDSGKRNGRNADLKVANWIGFFLDDVRGNDLYGRIMPIRGIYDKNAGPAPEGVFPRAIRLIH